MTEPVPVLVAVPVPVPNRTGRRRPAAPPPSWRIHRLDCPHLQGSTSDRRRELPAGEPLPEPWKACKTCDPPTLAGR